ncbi:amino acid ABC transporter permease [Paenibacillus sp. NPDC057967]|uniref:amino acid ABC transporter permease n=1 Tax=Paenibacillus sp. NPDC057967 TaxID=3346293 RepID=UPI0036D7A3BC
MTFYFGDVFPYIPLLLKGLAISLYITVFGMLVGSVLGVFVNLAKTGKSKVLRKISSAYIEIIRNTPLLVQLYLIYFGLGQLGININPLWSAMIGITLNNAAYTAEIFRAGFNSVSKGLREAGCALGMTSTQIFRHIILPPAIRSVFPALTNQLILLFLFSSVASVISLEELTYQIMNVDSKTFRTFEILTIGAILYYASSSIFAMLSKVIEKKLFRW